MSVVGFYDCCHITESQSESFPLFISFITLSPFVFLKNEFLFFGWYAVTIVLYCQYPFFCLPAATYPNTDFCS